MFVQYYVSTSSVKLHPSFDTTNLSTRITTILQLRGLPNNASTVTSVLEELPRLAFISTCDSRITNLINTTIDSLNLPNPAPTPDIIEESTIRSPSISTPVSSEPPSTISNPAPSVPIMSDHWEKQPDFEFGGNSNFCSWIDTLELRFQLDGLTLQSHAPRMFTILSLKIGVHCREILAHANISTYSEAVKLLKSKCASQLSVEASVMKLSMTNIEYSTDKFGPSLRKVGELLYAANPSSSPSVKLNIVIERLLTILVGPPQQRLLDKMSSYSSLEEMYIDLEFYYTMSQQSALEHKPKPFRRHDNHPRNSNSQNRNPTVPNQPQRCHHCNFIGHKKSNCRRFLAGLPRKDYTSQSKEKTDSTKQLCAVNNPVNNTLRAAIIVLQINGIPTRCLIDSGSAISIIHSDYTSYLPSHDCQLKIVGATGVEETIKSFSPVTINVGESSHNIALYHSRSSVVKDKSILGMDFLSLFKSTTIAAHGISLDNATFPFAEAPSNALSAAIDLAKEFYPIRSNYNTIYVNSIEQKPDASPVIPNEEILAKILQKYGDENLYSVFSTEKSDIGRCHIHAPYIQFDFSKVKSFKPFNFPSRIKEEAEKVIKEMITSGTLIEGPAKLLHNLIPVKKRDGSIRPTTDMRRSNEAAPFFDYPVHRVDRAVSEATGGDFYLMCDLISSFHQFPLHPDNIGDIGLYFNYKTYCYTSLPQGFKLSPQIMQSILDSLSIPNIKWYYDDGILKTVGSINDHLDNVRLVLLSLKKANLKISWKKTVLCSNQISYLGHSISKFGSQISESASQAIENLQPPPPKLKLFLVPSPSIAVTYQTFLINCCLLRLF